MPAYEKPFILIIWCVFVFVCALAASNSALFFGLMHTPLFAIVFGSFSAIVFAGLVFE